MPVEPPTSATPPETLTLRMLYDIARSERTFEISQIVQRNNFVMIFQGVLFAGFMQASSNKDFPSLIAFVVCAVGVLTGLAQYWMAAGAKFWQERWEIEVERIESKLKNLLTLDQQREDWVPLFTRCTKEVESSVRKRMLGKLFGGAVAARRSPSRLPIFVALVFVVAWGTLAFAQLEIKPGEGIKLVRIGSCGLSPRSSGALTTELQGNSRNS